MRWGAGPVRWFLSGNSDKYWRTAWLKGLLPWPWYPGADHAHTSDKVLAWTSIVFASHGATMKHELGRNAGGWVREGCWHAGSSTETTTPTQPPRPGNSNIAASTPPFDRRMRGAPTGVIPDPTASCLGAKECSWIRPFPTSPRRTRCASLTLVATRNPATRRPFHYAAGF